MTRGGSYEVRLVRGDGTFVVVSAGWPCVRRARMARDVLWWRVVESQRARVPAVFAIDAVGTLSVPVAELDAARVIVAASEHPATKA